MASPKSPAPSVDELRAIYEKFLAVKGDLFQSSLAPMNEEEIRILEKDARFTQTITVRVFFIFGILAIGGGIWCIATDTWIPGVGMLTCSIAFFAFSMYYKSSYKDLIEKKEKVVINGVVTNRKTYNGRYGKDYMVTLSRKKDIFIVKEDYEKVKLGDIVQYETLSEDHPIKSSIKVLGHIREFIDT